MMKSFLHSAFNLLLIASMIAMTVGCSLDSDEDTANTILIGANLEMTGELPEVGQASIQAIDMYLELLDSRGGLEINGITYDLSILLIDNESTVDGAQTATTTLLSVEDMMLMIGPNTSGAAVPSGQLANDAEIVMISPWSTNVQTTFNRPWVFRVSFIDSFQGLALAQFAESQYSGVNACVLYTDDDAYSDGLAESFQAEWVNLNGVVAASETFHTGDEDLSSQLSQIKSAGCDFLFLPQYANEIPAIIQQMVDMDIDLPVLGGDSWSNESLLDECGSNCEGFFFSKQFDASGATGMAADFVNNYQSRFNEIPDDVEALTWDAMLLVEQAIRNCGTITGNLVNDRTCIRDGLASVQNLEGVTGPISLDENGDPQKCASFIKIEDGQFTSFGSVCPD